MSGALLLASAITSSDQEWLLLPHAPLDALGRVVRDTWPIVLTGLALMLALMIGRYAWIFYRIPYSNRRLTFEATKQGLVTRDAADCAITMPWSMVVRVRNSGYVMRMKLASGGWRILFWRAFAPQDRAQVLRWAQQKGEAAINKIGTPIN